jgi:uncharacterized protein (TIGR00251 family)
MRLTVHVKPNARRIAVEVCEDGSLRVCLSARPVEGRANEQLIELLAEHFRKPKRDISIVAGRRGKVKIVEIA